MHGLVNRAFQLFVLDAQGAPVWDRIRQSADLPAAGFEPMLIYDDVLTGQLFDAAADIMGRPRGDVLEDFGTYLVSHPNMDNLRRLLRFGGRDFHDFLHSLDDLRDRATLAVPDLEMPILHLETMGVGKFRLHCRWTIPGVGWIALGILRAMADDYGALAVLDLNEGAFGIDHIEVDLLDASFGQAKDFTLHRLNA